MAGKVVGFAHLVLWAPAGVPCEKQDLKEEGWTLLNQPREKAINVGLHSMNIFD